MTAGPIAAQADSVHRGREDPSVSLETSDPVKWTSKNHFYRAVLSGVVCSILDFASAITEKCVGRQRF